MRSALSRGPARWPRAIPPFGRQTGWTLVLIPVAAASLYAFLPKQPTSAGDVEAQPARAAQPDSELPAEDARAPRVTPEVMADLEAALDERVADAPARAAAVYVQDIETGLTASVNPNRHFLAASLIKLPVMASAYELWEERPGLKTRLARTWNEWMITVSDNASTDRLIDMIGGPEVAIDFCRERGWRNFVVRHAILNHRGRRGRNLCTAREVTEFLVALDRRQLVSEEADEEMWEVLSRQKKRRRIPAGLPDLPEVEVGNKTGTLGNALHDAGIVRTPRARYALCILMSGQRSDAAGERFCREVSRLVFDTLHGTDEG